MTTASKAAVGQRQLCSGTPLDDGRMFRETLDQVVCGGF